jgi:hypothetical protein
MAGIRNNMIKTIINIMILFIGFVILGFVALCAIGFLAFGQPVVALCLFGLLYVAIYRLVDG